MKSIILTLFTVVCIVPSELWAVSPEDYDVSVSKAQQIRLKGNYFYDGRGSDTNIRGTTALEYNRRYFSLAYAWDLNFDGEGSINRNSGGTLGGSYNFRVGTGIRKYFNTEGDFFYSGESKINRESSYDRPAIDVIPGAGYGRFIRVTPLAEAVRIELFLLAEGIIKGPLPKETLVALAQVIERRWEFETQYDDRYKIKWFEAMEEVIAESGMFVEGGFGAVGSQRVNEVLFQENVNERFIGWDLRMGVNVEALTRNSEVARRDPRLSLQVRYSRPLGWKSQFNFNAWYDSPLTGDFGSVFTLWVEPNYLYEVTNRIDFTLRNTIIADRYPWRRGETEVSVRNHLRSGFIFFIENQIDLNVIGSIDKVRGRDLVQRIEANIGYRLR